MNKRILSVMLIGALAASCTTTGTGKVDAKLQEVLPQACAAVDVGYASFLTVSATGAIKPATVRKVEAGYASVQGICANPTKATAVSLVTQVLVVALTIKSALKEAENG